MQLSTLWDVGPVILTDRKQLLIALFLISATQKRKQISSYVLSLYLFFLKQHKLHDNGKA